MSPRSGTRRVVALVLACLLVVLAGCSALPFVGGGPSADDAYAEPGEPLNGTQLLGQHLDAVGEAGSLTVVDVRTVEYGRFGSDEFRTETSLDLETGEALRHRRQPVLGDDGLAERHVYHNGTAALVNETRGSGRDRYTHYYTVATPAEDPEIAPLDLSTYDRLDRMVDTLDWTHRGVETHDRSGAAVTRYTATEADARVRPEFAAAYGIESLSETEGFRATLLVEGDGLVRELRYRYNRTVTTIDGDEITVTERYVVAVEALGGVDVSEPEWAVRAR